MTDITQCPECGTRFKVTAAQLEAHGGEVRCGRCHGVFDAEKHLYISEPSPQLSLPIDPEPEVAETIEEQVIASAEIQAETQHDAAEIAETSEPEAAVQALSVSDEIAHDSPPDAAPDVPTQDETPSGEIEHFLPPLAELETPPPTLAQQVRFVDTPLEEIRPRPSHKHHWTTIALSALLLLVLAGQAVYFFRVELAVRLPGLKPLLTSYCAMLNCKVGLPQQLELLTIESSELEADPALSGVITLRALLHNRSEYPQAYPKLELTLNNLQDQAIARRVFNPADYLKSAQEEETGLAANREIEITLRLDTADLKPAGYRLLMYFPE